MPTEFQATESLENLEFRNESEESIWPNENFEFGRVSGSTVRFRSEFGPKILPD